MIKPRRTNYRKAIATKAVSVAVAVLALSGATVATAAPADAATNYRQVNFRVNGI